MLTVAPLANGQANYYLSLASAATSYYIDTKGLEPAGRWYGAGAAEFGLSGIVTSKALNSLCEGMAPEDPAKLRVRNAETEKRAHGTDLCFSAPKSVSLCWALSSDEMRKSIEAVLHRAAKDALDYIQDTCGYARVGAQGQQLVRVPLTFALFEHSSSRNGDVNFHIHAVTPNLAMHSEPKRRVTAIDSTLFYHHMMSGGALFRSSAAAGMAGLGFEIERDNSSFKVKNMSEKLCELTSTRRAEIIAAITERSKILGRLEGLDEEQILKATSGRMAEIMNLETRRMKRELSRADIFAATRKIADELGLPHNYIESLVQPQQKMTAEQKAEVKEFIWQASIEKISLQHSHWNERDLTRMLAEEAQDKGVNAREVRELLTNKLAENELIRIGELTTAEKSEKRQIWRDVSETRFTTREILLQEGEMLSAVERLENRFAGIDPKTVRSAIELTRDKLAEEGKKLSIEQAKAVVTLTGKESIACLEGLPGTTKSTILGACRIAWELSGKTVLGTAIAGIAADSLHESSGIQSDTLAMMLTRLKHERLWLTPNHVITLDEGGMVPTRMMAELVHHVEKAGAKLVIAGDRSQIPAIEAGGPFASICDRIKAMSTLTEIHRQREPWRKDAVVHFSKGEAREALIAYAARDQLHITPTRDLAMMKLVELWKENGGHLKESVRDNYIVAPLNSEVRAINRLCQIEREKHGELGEKFLKLGTEKIHENDRIVLTKKDRNLKVENGFQGEVVSVDEAAQRLKVRLDKGGREVVIPLESYGADRVKLSYCSTVHLSQGSTRESVFVLLGLGDKNLSNVAASRSKGVTHLVADHVEVGKDPVLRDAIRTLSKAMSRDRTKDLAMDRLDQSRNQLAQDLEQRRRDGLYHGLSL